MRVLIFIIAYISIVFSQQQLTPPSDLPSGTPYLSFSKVICDFDADKSDDIFTLWSISGSADRWVSIYSTKNECYMKSFKVTPNNADYNTNLSYGKLDDTNYFILFYGYLITHTSTLSKKKALIE